MDRHTIVKLQQKQTSSIFPAAYEIHSTHLNDGYTGVDLDNQPSGAQVSHWTQLL